MFGRVKRCDRIIIVASGPSLERVDLAQINASSAFIIAVNGAISKVKADAFFTCDPSDRIRALLRCQRSGVQYFAAVPEDYGMRQAKAQSHRAMRERNVTYLRRLTGDGPWSHLYGLSEDQGAIHTGNSAYGALGLAYLMGARRVAFLGLDGGGKYAFGLPGQPGDLSHLPAIFESVLPQLRRRRVKVVNGNPCSTVTCFPRMTPQEALEWTS